MPSAVPHIGAVSGSRLSSPRSRRSSRGRDAHGWSRLRAEAMPLAVRYVSAGRFRCPSESLAPFFGLKQAAFGCSTYSDPGQIWWPGRRAFRKYPLC
jgi:hypothetical protein